MTPEWELPRTPPASLPHLRTGRTRACLPSPASNSPTACQPGGPAPAATVPACCGGPRRAACHKGGRAPQAPVAGCAAAPQRRPQLTPRLQHRRRRARRAARRLRARRMSAPGSRVSGRPGCRPHGLRAAAACCGTPQCACSGRSPAIRQEQHAPGTASRPLATGRPAYIAVYKYRDPPPGPRLVPAGGPRDPQLSGARMATAHRRARGRSGVRACAGAGGTRAQCPNPISVPPAALRHALDSGTAAGRRGAARAPAAPARRPAARAGGRSRRRALAAPPARARGP